MGPLAGSFMLCCVAHTLLVGGDRPRTFFGGRARAAQPPCQRTAPLSPCRHNRAPCTLRDTRLGVWPLPCVVCGPPGVGRHDYTPRACVPPLLRAVHMLCFDPLFGVFFGPPRTLRYMVPWGAWVASGCFLPLSRDVWVGATSWLGRKSSNTLIATCFAVLPCPSLARAQHPPVHPPSTRCWGRSPAPPSGS